MSLGQSASLNGFVPFPADNLWNKDISSAPVDPNSAAIINFIGSGIGLHPDFGSGLYNGSEHGHPVFGCRLAARAGADCLHGVRR